MSWHLQKCQYKGSCPKLNTNTLAIFTMDNPIKQFEIKGLFGYKDIEITFNNKVMIVIGENGFGKTSILNALTYTLKGDWQKLSKIKFCSIKISFSDLKEYEFTHKILMDYCEYIGHVKKETDHDFIDVVKENIGEKEYQKLCAYVAEGKRKEYHNMVSNSQLLKMIPESVLFNNLYARLEREKNFGVFMGISTSVDEIGCEILYLPTYRRVEVGIDSLQIPVRRNMHLIYEEDQSQYEEWNNELICFGMNDVQKRIDQITSAISQSSIVGYAEVSGDMIRQLLERNNQENHVLTCNKAQMEIVLTRIGASLTDEEKHRILLMLESQSPELLDNQYLVYFLEQLLAVYKKQEKFDTAIKDFCTVCNKYLNDKAFYFDESNVNLNIYNKYDDKILFGKDNEVLLNQLSSGEKQIVSIFSQIYLNIDTRFLILIDEPEMSLSLFWQENFLPDLLASGKCDFLMAVTHSPFIFGEKLKQYTVGINEFLTKKNYDNNC